jgi:Bacterial low temperature requirement A protein (LtrA)
LAGLLSAKPASHNVLADSARAGLIPPSRRRRGLFSCFFSCCLSLFFIDVFVSSAKAIAMTTTSDESDLKGHIDVHTSPESPPGEKDHNHDHHSHLHLHHAHHHGHRLLEFVHPHTGRTIHVVHTPEEFEKKRRELTREETKDSTFSTQNFDLILNGSPEHIDAIRGLHAQHTSHEEKLKEEHAHVYEKFEHVRNELDVLNAELHMLTDHSVALDASFDKFGYSAHLRTKDDSETSSLRSEHSEHKHNDRTAPPLKFFKRPVVRQYFHKGLLWRSSKSGEVPSFELFIDLVYVGVIDIIGEKAIEHPSGLSLLHFVIVFSIGWKIWADLTNVINWFDIDDIFQRICVAFYLICLFGFCTNIFYMFEEEESTYKSAVAFYIAQRLFLGLWYVMVARLVPMIRGTMASNAFLIATAVAFWIGSMHVEWPGQLALIFIGIVIDLFGGILLVAIMRNCNKNHGFGRWAQKVFSFSSHLHAHFPRTNILCYSGSNSSPLSTSNTASSATTPSSR